MDAQIPVGVYTQTTPPCGTTDKWERWPGTPGAERWVWDIVSITSATQRRKRDISRYRDGNNVRATPDAEHRARNIGCGKHACENGHGSNGRGDIGRGATRAESIGRGIGRGNMGRGIGRRNIGRGRNQGNTPRDGIVKAHTGTRSSRLAKAFPPPGLEPRGPSEVGDRRAQPGAAGGRFDNAVADRRLERRTARGRRYSPIPIPRISQSASRQYPKGKSQPAKYPT